MEDASDNDDHAAIVTSDIFNTGCRSSEVTRQGEIINGLITRDHNYWRSLLISFIFQLSRSESEVLYNLTTIEPDDETINTLIDAVDTAVTSLQNAIGGATTTDSSAFDFNYDFNNYNYDLDDFNPPDPPIDYFTGNEYYDLFDPDDLQDIEDVDYSQVYQTDEEEGTNNIQLMDT